MRWLCTDKRTEHFLLFSSTRRDSLRSVLDSRRAQKVGHRPIHGVGTPIAAERRGGVRQGLRETTVPGSGRPGKGHDDPGTRFRSGNACRRPQRASGLEHDLGPVVLVPAEPLIALGGLLQRQAVRDHEGRVQLSLLNAAQQVVGIGLHMGLSGAQLQPLLHQRAKRELVHEARHRRQGRILSPRPPTVSFGQLTRRA